MHVFLSAMEVSPAVHYIMLKRGIKYKYMLFSFFYLRQKSDELIKSLFDNSREILIDSGAYSLQVSGKKIDWDDYMREYCAFIRKWDCNKIIGYFEMDIDVLVGYDKVIDMRRKMLSVTDKVIPVWHKNRGIQDFKDMCDRYRGRIVSISGLENRDVHPEDYNKFYNYAHNHGCKMHCLGMTKKTILDTVPFEYVDSASWVIGAVNGWTSDHRKVNSEFRRNNLNELKAANFCDWLKRVEYYEQKYKLLHNDI